MQTIGFMVNVNPVGQSFKAYVYRRFHKDGWLLVSVGKGADAETAVRLAVNEYRVLRAIRRFF